MSAVGVRTRKIRQGVRRLPLSIAAPFVGAVVVLFALVVVTEDWATAWELLAGLDTPFPGATAAKVVLSVAGYLILPVFIGIAVGAWVDNVVVQRLETVERKSAELSKLLASPEQTPDDSETRD